jgi:hypothetical protein
MLLSISIDAQTLNLQDLYNDSVNRLIAIDNEAIFLESNAHYTGQNRNVLLVSSEDVKKKAKRHPFTLVKLLPISQEKDRFFICFIFYKINYKKTLNFEAMGNIKFYYDFDCASHAWIFAYHKGNFI